MRAGTYSVSFGAEAHQDAEQVMVADRVGFVDPLFGLHRWKANLWFLEIDEIKTMPYIRVSRLFLSG